METPRFQPLDRDLVISDVAPGYVEPDEEDALFTTDSSDYSDDTVVRELLDLVAQTLMLRHPLQLTTLNEQEWQEQLELRFQNKSRVWGNHCVRSDSNPHHLLVSPACVEATNRGDRQMIAEILDTVWGGLFADNSRKLSSLFAAGLRHLVIDACGEAFGMKGLAKIAPFHAMLVRGLSRILASDPRFEWLDRDVDPRMVELQWAQLLARDPDRFFLALRKSGFGSCWLERTRQDGEVSAVVGTGERPLERLCELLRAPELTTNDPLFRVTLAAAMDYLEQ